MGNIFLKLFNMGLTASSLILAVMVFRVVLRRAPRWIFCLLWGLVAFKLVCPFSIESAFSLVPSSEPLPGQIMTENTFYVDTGIELVDAPVNDYLGDHYYEGVSVPADNGNHVMDVLGIVWAAGVLGFALYGLISYYRLRRVTKASLQTAADIFQCDGIDTPFVLGIIRPCIFLPSEMGKEQAAYVIAHERAHLKRKDHWWKFLGFLLLSIYWFQPLCWAAYILLCRDIELACDEKVIRELDGENKKAYAQALLSCSIRQSAVTACPLAFGEVGVKERVKNVLHYKKPAFWIVAAAILCCVVAVLCFLTNPKKEEQNVTTPEQMAEREEMNRLTPEQTAEGENTDAESEKESLSEEAQRRQDALADTLSRWRKAFQDRDGRELAGMMSEDLRKERFPEENDYEFGYSSPWPWNAEEDSELYACDEEHAEIYYYAYTSDPHVFSWRETLQFGWEGDTCIITGEELTCYDYISTGADFEAAYPHGIDHTMMDYTENGLGETLNDNALLSSSMAYRDLFEPESAAAFLLNLLKNPEKVRLSLQESGQDGAVGVEITFVEGNRTFVVSMIQPYGSHGIWVPVND